MVHINVAKSLYRIRQELYEEGIFIMPDHLYHLARRHHLRLRPVREVYEREVYGLDEDDAERLKELARKAYLRSQSSRPRTEKGDKK